MKSGNFKFLEHSGTLRACNGTDLPLFLNRVRITGTLHDDQSIFCIISRTVPTRIRNVSDKICRENQNKLFVLNNIFFFENRAVCDIMR